LTENGSNGNGTWKGYLAEQHGDHFQELLEFLRIPSISTNPENRGDVAEAAEWVANRLRTAGVPEVEVLPSAGHPNVLARWHAAPGKPTVLVYGHFDVQPVDPLNLWESDPFDPTIRAGEIYARGVADMKTNMLTLIQAVEAFARTDGQPPVNLTFLFEGEEEIGSPNLPKVVAAEKARLACDVALSADGGMAGPEQPAILVGLKGICAVQVDLRTGSTDLHSGSYGAAVPNAVQQLVALAGTFHKEDGTVAVEGFYDTVRPLSDEERAEIAEVPYNEAEFLDEAGVKTTWGEPGYSVLERRWARPTLDLNGIWGGFQGAGTKTVTPCEAHLKITCRLVVDQEPEQIVQLLQRHVEKYCPPGVTANVVVQETGARPYVVRRDNPAFAVAARVLEEQYGVAPWIVRSGGSVPITEVFQRELGVDTVTIGFGLPGSRVHAPNEWFRVADFDRARSVYAAYFDALGATA
jgi:acetylornithine deacetylase/succinyl-diaminopimelate desuccinylase-like protein